MNIRSPRGAGVATVTALIRGYNAPRHDVFFFLVDKCSASQNDIKHCVLLAKKAKPSWTRKNNERRFAENQLVRWKDWPAGKVDEVQNQERKLGGRKVELQEAYY